MAMMDRLVVHPEKGQEWFFSPCATDALVQAATRWNLAFCDLLDAFRRGEVRVLVRKEASEQEKAIV